MAFLRLRRNLLAPILAHATGRSPLAYARARGGLYAVSHGHLTPGHSRSATTESCKPNPSAASTRFSCRDRRVRRATARRRPIGALVV